MKISKSLNAAINTQIKHELESWYLYLSMAQYLESISLSGMAHWMNCQADEELEHAKKFMCYLNDRGGRVVLQNLVQEKTDWGSPLEVFIDGLAHERQITKWLSELMLLIRKEGDLMAEPLLDWYLLEQVEEEAKAQDVVDKLQMIGNDGPGLLELDEELGERQD